MASDVHLPTNCIPSGSTYKRLIRLPHGTTQRNRVSGRLACTLCNLGRVLQLPRTIGDLIPKMCATHQPLSSERQRASYAPCAHSTAPHSYYKRGIADPQSRSKAGACVLGRGRRGTVAAVLVETIKAVKSTICWKLNRTLPAHAHPRPNRARASHVT